MNTSCFGTKIPFRYTSTYLTKIWLNNGNMMDTIRTFEALRYVPKCWAVVQVKRKHIKIHLVPTKSSFYFMLFVSSEF